MRKTMEAWTEPSKNNGRVLARLLAEDLRRTQGGEGLGGSVADTITDLGGQYDITVRGSDAY